MQKPITPAAQSPFVHRSGVADAVVTLGRSTSSWTIGSLRAMRKASAVFNINVFKGMPNAQVAIHSDEWLEPAHVATATKV